MVFFHLGFFSSVLICLIATVSDIDNFSKVLSSKELSIPVRIPSLYIYFVSLGINTGEDGVFDSKVSDLP